MPRAWLALLLLPWASLAVAASSVKVSDAWIRGIPPGMSVTAGYLVLRNDGRNARTVSGVSSPAFRAAEIHQTVERKDGSSAMIRHLGLDIDAGQVLEFKPHSYHLMLLDPLQPLRIGSRIPLSLILWDGSRIEFEAEVRK